jgi:hypothetical protein
VKPDELAFESEICAWLTDQGGYDLVKVGNARAAGPPDFDATRGLDTAELFAFIGVTQANAWARLQGLYGGDPDHARRAFADRVAQQIDALGTVEVLRHGVDDRSVTIQLAYFKPAHGLTPALLDRYHANRLTVPPLTFDLEGWQAVRKTPLLEDPVLPAWLAAPCRSTAWGVLPPAGPGARTSNRDMRKIAHS